MFMGVVADDITGSNDIGIMFANSGCQVNVYPYAGSQADPGQYNGPDILILDTNSGLEFAATGL